MDLAKNAKGPGRTATASSSNQCSELCSPEAGSDGLQKTGKGWGRMVGTPVSRLRASFSWLCPVAGDVKRLVFRGKVQPQQPVLGASDRLEPQARPGSCRLVCLFCGRSNGRKTQEPFCASGCEECGYCRFHCLGTRTGEQDKDQELVLCWMWREDTEKMSGADGDGVHAASSAVLRCAREGSAPQFRPLTSAAGRCSSPAAGCDSQRQRFGDKHWASVTMAPNRNTHSSMLRPSLSGVPGRRAPGRSPWFLLGSEPQPRGRSGKLWIARLGGFPFS